MENKLNTGGIFWLVWIGISLLSFLYLSLYSAMVLGSLLGTILGVIFIMIILIANFFGKFELIMNDSFGISALSYTIGFWLFVIVSSIATSIKSLSIFSMGTNQLMATISGEIPQFWEFLINAITIPVAEELLWLIGIPILIFKIMDIAAMKYDFMKNQWLQIFIATVISGLTFAFFHVGKVALIGFIIAALIFRTLMIGIYWGDERKNIIPWLVIAPSFAIGAHQANNWIQIGLGRGFEIILSSTGVEKALGVVILLWIGFIFIVSLEYILSKIIPSRRDSR